MAIVGLTLVSMVELNLLVWMLLSGLKNVKKEVLVKFLLTSMDRDGTKDGYDLELTKAINDSVDIPVIASGGVGKPEHIFEAFDIADASAALAASIFHFNEYPIPEVKEYLKEKNINVRF